ncbi:cell division protein ZapE [Rhodococcus sp. LBL1]|nr:cell division protein ZapE [Rhodococcus sp. LBL1]MDH6681714.1 cell division protein ZapE [Rhodococcus sp. LBL2]
MKLFRRTRPPTLRVPRGTFDEASRASDFVLDTTQRRAAAELEDADGRWVYLWGPVGRGKSWLMDTYFAAVPADRKLRVHFHAFFVDLHSTLERHRYDLHESLGALLGDVRLLCFDEFHVHDIGDAKFLERLLPALLDRGVTLVVTSNHPPAALLPNPLFHDAFLPTIALIERTMTVVTVDGPRDYRTLTGRHDTGFASGVWAAPGDPGQLTRLGLTRPRPDESRLLRPVGHPIAALRADDDCLWFTFADLCGGSTAPADYLALTRTHRTWVVSEVPALHVAGRDASQRFVNLVDVLYDDDVRVVILADEGFFDSSGIDCPAADIERVMSRLRQLRPAPAAPAVLPGEYATG